MESETQTTGWGARVGDGLKRVARIVSRPSVWLTLVFLGAAGVGVAWGSWQNLCATCPSVARIYTWEPQQTSKLYAHDGSLLTEIGLERRTPVSIEALPPHVPQAFVAVEDKRFYQHRGIDPIGITRAAFGVLTSGSFSGGGGSTITQQLARNMFTERIGFEKRITRKLKELQVALQLERVYSKDQILEAYINQINYAHGWYGIQTAARNYFGKNASELTVAEAALLAAIPNRPEYYSPLRNPDNAIRRRNTVLERMVDQGFISEEVAFEAGVEPVPTERAVPNAGLAPYFEEWVRQILDDRFGFFNDTATTEIYTTLDADMQRAAQEAMEWGWDRLEAQPGFEHPRYGEFADRTDVFPGATPYVQGLFIALDPATGAVRALIGGRDFNHSKFNRATQANRQAGSSFKPFVYTSAIASGIPASHFVVDAPVVLPQVSGEEWKPKNFDEEFHGPMTIREGLRRSINMVAIKLGLEVGLESVAQTAWRMGVRTPIERFPSTAIGAATVIPIQMAEAYSGFATLGTKVRPHPIVRVESPDGDILWAPQPDRTQVLDSLVARVAVSMLEDVATRGTAATALRIVSQVPPELPAGGKTGTTNDGTDTWFIGFTPSLMAVVWFGMDQPQQIRPKATGGGDAAPVWGRFMKRVYFGAEEWDGVEMTEEGERAEGAPLLPLPEPWPILPGLVTRDVDDRTGKLASQWCPPDRVYTELYIEGTEPTEPCDLTGPSLLDVPGSDR
jgi:penicillin-binding protein 1A